VRRINLAEQNASIYLSAIGYYRFRLGIVFAQVAAHEQRHLLQAQRVREHPDFPKPVA